jgi:hypothetical protein
MEMSIGKFNVPNELTNEMMVSLNVNFPNEMGVSLNVNLFSKVFE